ncbi:MAG: hypothetical protein EA397_00195 [Deltaproteobacteria bacterium]|nr:MAG: hypothetical protein EA397_00195 [Deltaproteobacteria bacterium]
MLFGMSPLRRIVAKVSFVVLGVGFLVYGAWSYLDGRALLTTGVEARVTQITSVPRGGHNLHFVDRAGASHICNVSEDPPHAVVVYDPQAPWRCRLPQAVGKLTGRETFMFLFGPLLVAVFLGMSLFERMTSGDDWV